MKLLSCAAQFRTISIKITHRIVVEYFYAVTWPSSINTYIRTRTCMLNLNIGISNYVSEIICIKKTGIFIGLQKLYRIF